MFICYCLFLHSLKSTVVMHSSNTNNESLPSSTSAPPNEEKRSPSSRPMYTRKKKRNWIRKRVIVSKTDFPESRTIREIEREYEIYHTDPSRIFVLGLSRSSRSIVANAMLSTQCTQNESVDELDSKMVHSQYETECSIITEHTMMDISERAAQNLKYCHVFKNEITSSEIRTVIQSEPDPANMGSSRKIRDHIRKMKAIYNRLSKFTAETLKNEQCTYSVVRDYNALCPGYIRRIPGCKHIAIPLDITSLIQSFYELDKQLIDCYKFQWRVPNRPVFSIWNMPPDTYDLNDTNGLSFNVSGVYVDGMVIVVDIEADFAIYNDNQKVVDKGGVEWDRLIYLQTIWKEMKSLAVPMVALCLARNTDDVKHKEDIQSIHKAFGETTARERIDIIHVGKDNLRVQCGRILHWITKQKKLISDST